MGNSGGIARTNFNVSLGFEASKYGIDADNIQSGQVAIVPPGKGGICFHTGVPDHPDILFIAEGFSDQFHIVLVPGIDDLVKLGMCGEPMAISGHELDFILQKQALESGIQESVQLFNHGTTKVKKKCLQC